MIHALSNDGAVEAVLSRRPEELALACRAALDARGDVRDADRALREIATAFAAVAGHPRLDVVVTSRTNRAVATCTAPNCAGHRVRA